MRILVMQTTRMGDVIQTSPLIHALRQRHPKAHIALMVRNMGKAAADHNPDVDEVLIYEEDEMFNATRARDSDRMLQAYRRAEDEIARIRDGHFDVVYNCTHSIASAMLIKLSGAPNVIGAHLSDDWQFVLRGAWINYFFTSVFHREYNDLNLCDITQRFAEGAEPCHKLHMKPNEEDYAFVRNLLREQGVAPEDFFVCFQLGASEENKRWSESNFANLAGILRDKFGAKIALVGVKEESVLGDVFEQCSPGLAIHLFGKTTIPQLAALLDRANLLVSNDTGTMHIAATTNCPIVLVSVGYVHFRETGPYGEGHCAIERRRFRLGRADSVPGGLDERKDMRPEAVFRAIEMTLSIRAGHSIEQSENDEGLEDVDIYMTRFAPDGCLQWRPLLRRPPSETDFLRIAYRAAWLEHLEGRARKKIERESVEAILQCYDPPDSVVIEKWKNDFRSVFTGLAEIAVKGIGITENLLSQLSGNRNIRRAQQLVEELNRIDKDMRIYGELHPQCKPLVLISRYERDNLEGADPIKLAKRTLQIYEDCRNRSMLTAAKLNLVADCFKR